MIGSGRDKIETPEQLKKAADTVWRLELDGLVVCGGDDSNTNAAVLAEYFLAQGAPQLLLEKVPLVLGQDRTFQSHASSSSTRSCVWDQPVKLHDLWAEVIACCF